MAEIILGGVKVDTEDTNLLVQHCPLGTLEGAVKFDSDLLKVMPADHPERPYWENRLSAHRLAFDIAEWYWQNTTVMANQELQAERVTYELEDDLRQEVDKLLSQMKAAKITRKFRRDVI